ncbi:unnamed protein product [Diatraea saccharalis]|uniref:Uncharacterized protein n=1 Tax=Diatraea saccharalis TaxID=40085 RepID=A0A9N9WD45_9NEOP|nr:unnamed protein product [Diatraea saccharalis]
MNSNVKSPHSARSRVPIDNIGVKWWDLYGASEATTSECYVQNEVDVEQTEEQNKIVDKSTCTNNLLQRYSSIKVYKDDNGKIANLNPKDIVLKKWREEQAKAKYEQARKAVIKSLKEKFEVTPHANTRPIPGANKTCIRKIIPTIIITGDSEISNLNANVASQGKRDSAGEGFKVEIGDGNDAGACHASRLQVGPGGELAQWRPSPGGSRAACAEGGIRGFARETMPVLGS